MDLTTAEKRAIAEAIAILDGKARHGEGLTSPQAARDLFRLHLTPYDHEVFAAAWLDNRHRLIQFQRLFAGTIDGASVHPRVVVQQALKLNAASVIFGHNHPSGVCEPSQADLRITTRLKEALALIDLRVLDHLICGDGEPVSLAERGLM